MRLLALIAAGVLVGGLASAPVPKVTKVKDEEAILGTWTVEKYDLGPNFDLPVDRQTRMQYVFEKDGQMVYQPGVGEAMRATYKLDPAEKPSLIDLKYPSSTFLGVYKLDGDTLTLCIQPTKPFVRPTEIKSDAKGIQVIITLKRVKDEPKKDK